MGVVEIDLIVFQVTALVIDAFKHVADITLIVAHVFVRGRLYRSSNRILYDNS
jgi:hypothetical protein